MFRGGRRARLISIATLTFSGLFLAGAAAQETTAPSRAAEIEQAQAAKEASAHAFQPGKVEDIFNRIEDLLVPGRLNLHPFFQSAYGGGGFTLGAGYAHFVSPYNVIDLRGSITFSGYKRIEAEFLAPRLFNRRGSLSLLGGWREATAVGFFGTGSANTSIDDRANYSFTQPYGAAMLQGWPMRKLLVVRGGVELSTWNQGSGSGSAPSVEEVYTPETLPGLGSSPTYVHSEGGVALDFRPAADYARRGGYYGVAAHDFHDQDAAYGFRQIDYEAIQHLPIMRERWVLSLHGRVQAASETGGQAIPFYMLPSLGGGSSLRGYGSWRFRDRNSLLLQADWRVIPNRFLDMALFYDAGRVAARTSELTDAPLKSDYGIGFRFHGPVSTPLRIDIAKSNEGFQIAFSAKAAF